MKENKGTSRVYMAAIIYSIITGLSFLFGKVGLEYSAPLDLLAHRFTAAFLAVSIPVLFKFIKVDINKEMIKRALPLSIFYPLGYMGFQTFGLRITQSSEAGILLAIGPVFTMILASYFLKEKTTPLQKASILLSVFGVIYITIKKGSSFEVTNIKGIALILVSVMSFAIYSVMARKLTQEYSSLDLSFVMTAISFISFNVLAIGKHLIDGDIMNFLAPLKEGSFIVSVLYLGVLSSFVTSLLSNFVLSKLQSSKMSVFANLATVISVVAGVVFLKEEIFYYHIIGSILIIVGVVGTNLFGEKTKSLKEDI